MEDKGVARADIWSSSLVLCSDALGMLIDSEVSEI
jgi:hypothetical protein